MGHKLTLPKDFKKYDFLKTMKKMNHGRNRIRLLAMYQTSFRHNALDFKV